MSFALAISKVRVLILSKENDGLDLICYAGSKLL